MTDSEVMKAWEAYAEARLQKELASDAEKAANKELKIANAKFVEALLEAEQKGIKFADDVYPHIAEMPLNPAVNQDNSDDVEKWLFDQVGDVAPFKKEVLHKPAVTEYIKKRMDEGTPREEFPDFLNVKVYHTIKVNGWAKKKAEMLS